MEACFWHGIKNKKGNCKFGFYISQFWLFLKVGYVFFQKPFRKWSRAQYQNKLVSNVAFVNENDD